MLLLSSCHCFFRDNDYTACCLSVFYQNEEENKLLLDNMKILNFFQAWQTKSQQGRLPFKLIMNNGVLFHSQTLELHFLSDGIILK